MLFAGRRPIQIVRIRLAFTNEGHQSGRAEKVDSVRRVQGKKKKQSAENSPLYGIRQRFVLFGVGAQKPEHDGLVRTLVRPLIEEIAPVGERIVGRWRAAAGVGPALDEGFGGRFGHGEALGGEFGIGAIHEVFTFRRLYFVFGIDGVNVVVHPCTIEDEEAIRGIRSSEWSEL